MSIESRIERVSKVLRTKHISKADGDTWLAERMPTVNKTLSAFPEVRANVVKAIEKSRADEDRPGWVASVLWCHPDAKKAVFESL